MAWLEVTMSHGAFRPGGKLTRAFRLIRGTGFVASAVGALLLLASCGSKESSGPHATILMRDGSALTGTVTATSPAEITLAGDDNTAHTVPMAQVKSIEYDDTATTQTGATQTGSTSAQRPSAARAASDSYHENHYHP